VKYSTFKRDSNRGIVIILILAVFMSVYFMADSLDVYDSHLFRFARFEVFMAVKIEFMIFWVVAPCSVVVRYQCPPKCWCPSITLHGATTQKSTDSFCRLVHCCSSYVTYLMLWGVFLLNSDVLSYFYIYFDWLRFRSLMEVEISW
jgi:hypothetical protein